MDGIYGIDSARQESNIGRVDNGLYNEQILSTRDRINNSLDAEKITAQGNLRSQESTDTQDKIIYDLHDTLSGTGFASSLGRISESLDAYDKAKASLGGGGLGTFLRSQAAVRRGNVDKVFGSATNTGDKIADVVTNRVSDVRKNALPKSLGGGTGVQTAQPLTEAQQSSFLDESAAAMGADARPAPTLDERDRAETARVQSDPNRPNAPISEQTTAEVNNRPKTNEPASANENTPEITEPKGSTSTTDELSGQILETKEKVKEGFSKASTGLRVLNDVGGAVGTYEMFKNGFSKNPDGTIDRWNEVSQIAGTVGTGLDIVGAFIPALEPLAGLAQAVGAIADTVDTHNKDEQATTEAQNEVDNVETQRKAQLDALPQMKTSQAPVNTMVSGGLVGTQSQHINNATQGTGSF